MKAKAMVMPGVLQDMPYRQFNKPSGGGTDGWTHEVVVRHAELRRSREGKPPTSAGLQAAVASLSQKTESKTPAKKTSRREAF